MDRVRVEGGSGGYRMFKKSNPKVNESIGIDLTLGPCGKRVALNYLEPFADIIIL